MSKSIAFRFGWKALLVCAAIVAVSSINTPRAGRAYDPKANPKKRTTTKLIPQGRADNATKSAAQVIAKGRNLASTSVRELRGNQPFKTSSGTVSAAGTSPCTVAGNCQARDISDARRSNRTEFNAADDFRPSASGNITEACWWGAYGDDASGVLLDCHAASVIDSFEITYCNDAGGVPGNTCTTFSQTSGTLTVDGPTPTGEFISGSIPEFAFTATHAPFAVSAGVCYWIEITNNSGTCTWFWEISAEGGDWAMLDGDGVNPPNGFALNEFVLHDFAFCVDVGLSADTPCGPPPNAACPNLEQDCCVSGPDGVAGCSNDLCCRRVCACDDLCCNPVSGWDPFCAATGVPGLSPGCGAEALCVSECSPCGGPNTGDCCTDTGSASCNDATCCDAVCAVDPFCCDDTWDELCSVQAETICPELCGTATCGDPKLASCCEANPLEPFCSDAACCEAVCALDGSCCSTNIGWDNDCATLGFPGTGGAGAQLVCPDLCGCADVCGDINGDSASVNGPASNTDLLDFALFANCYGLVPSTSPECLCSDLTADGVIDEADFQLLAAFFEATTTNIRGACVAP